MMTFNQQFKNQLGTLARAEHLEFLGVTPLGPSRDFYFFQEWLKKGMHAQMQYLEAYAEVRADSSKIMPGAKSALLFVLPYFFEEEGIVGPGEPRIARYARLKDYHQLLRSSLTRISSQLPILGKPMIDFRIMVDSAPLFERSLAVQTGRGFIGRNSCYILPDFGSYVVLGEIVTTTAFHWDTSIDHEAPPACQSCRRCQAHCPTGALQTPYSIDARRCLSYWTIEHQGPIPVSFWPHLKTFYFGCDVCQQVCPFNSQIKHKASDSWIKLESCPDLMTVATMDQKKYEELFGGTPLTRAKIHGLRRNALIAMHVTAHPMIEEALGMIDMNAHPALSQTRQQILDQRALKEADTFSQ